MNQNILKIIDNAIEKAVNGIAKKAALLCDLEQLAAQPVPAFLTFEQLHGKKQSSILAQIQAAETMANLTNETRAVRSIANSAIYPNARHISTPEAKNNIWLLEHGLIFTPGELAHMRTDYTDPVNPVMLRLIERYAKEHFPKNVKEFAFENDDADKYIRAIDTLAQLAQDAINGNGAAAAKLEEFIDLATGKADAESFVKWANEKA